MVREGYRDERACVAKSPDQWRVGFFFVLIYGPVYRNV